ncbi:ElyC/SanA/YdcF family protein [Sulfurovum sp. NBC37-1]|uniref:ElyC/SanA/YdcF family protein n=1 Tax=Sulfurovum sp. (strain NBC37-1) TaxID=387093 RepID=UPI001E2CA2DD|nr:ElyC/SanA/YdcF family protein [Sulfurovum sp. NBC37-1]
MAIFFLSRQKVRRAKSFLYVGIIWLFLFSYAPFANILLHPIESAYSALQHAPKNTRYIYVLGNGHTTDRTLPITSQLASEAIVRLNEGIRLYRQLEGNATIILSGYEGLHDPTPHAFMQEKLATALGIDPKDLILRTTAKDTEEEAQAARQIAKDQPLILVTSAYHMPRAMGWFEKEGLHPVPAPTYHQASLQNQDYFGIFSADALRKSTIAFHELFGSLWQKVKGV